MPNTVVNQSLSWVDAKGHTGVTKAFISYDTIANGGTLVGSLATVMAALSNAAQNGGSGLGALPPTPGLRGTQATFGSIEDKATFTFVDSDGNIHRFTVPAPKSAIFLADGETVDGSNVSVGAYVNVILNSGSHPYFVASRDGIAMSIFAGGIRQRRKIRRKTNIFTRNPTETGPDE